MINPSGSRPDGNLNSISVGATNGAINPSGRSHLVPEDFVPLVQDVVDTHPGLTFLKEATEFHSRYVHTVFHPFLSCLYKLSSSSTRSRYPFNIDCLLVLLMRKTLSSLLEHLLKSGRSFLFSQLEHKSFGFMTMTGDCPDILQREPFMVWSDHVVGTAPFKFDGDYSAVRRWRGHQSNHRLL